MSTPIAQYKLPSRIEIGFDSETKASIADLKTKLDEAAKGLSAKDSNGVNGLLKTMQAEAANDSNGIAPQRETINDVDYLSETVPYIDEDERKEFESIVFDESDLVANNLVEATADDGAHLGFIKSLASLLIIRMQAMDRFSEDDSAIDVAELMPWDIVFDRGAKAFGVITNTHTDSTVSAVFFPKHECGLGNNNFHIASLKGRVTQTITKAQLTEFRESLEACYA